MLQQRHNCTHAYTISSSCLAVLPEINLLLQLLLPQQHNQASQASMLWLLLPQYAT
jgi:hypothetical protein